MIFPYSRIKNFSYLKNTWFGTFLSSYYKYACLYHSAPPLRGKWRHLSIQNPVWIFMVTLLIIIKSWKQPKCLSASEWINKFRHLHIMEYYSTIKRNKYCYVQHREWISEAFILSTRSYTQKFIHSVILLVWHSIKSKTIRTLDQWRPWTGVGIGIWLSRGLAWGTFWVMEMFYVLR